MKCLFMLPRCSVSNLSPLGDGQPAMVAQFRRRRRTPSQLRAGLAELGGDGKHQGRTRSSVRCRRGPGPGSMSARPPDRGCAARPGAQRGVAELPELGRRGGLIARSCGRRAAGIATSLPGREPLRTACRNHGETAAAPGDRTGGLTASGPAHGGLPPVRYPGYSPAPARRRNAAALHGARDFTRGPPMVAARVRLGRITDSGA